MGGGPPHEIFYVLKVLQEVSPGMFYYEAHFLVTGCRSGAAPAANPVAPSIFLADVCEPHDGFSSDGWMTLDTDADELGADTTLYVGASASGPWIPVAANGPSWALSHALVEQLAISAGVTSYNHLWVQVGEGGKAANLGSLIIGRAARMDALCN